MRFFASTAAAFFHYHRPLLPNTTTTTPLAFSSSSSTSRSRSRTLLPALPPTPRQQQQQSSRKRTSCLLRASAFSSSSSSSSSDNQEYPTIHSSFAEIVDLYDAFVLDQFGVLHDGTAPLDGAIELVNYLQSRNKAMVILSNTSAPAHKALEKLQHNLGFPPFSHAVTSGEEASKYVLKTFGSGDLSATARPSRALFLTWDATQPNNPRLTAPPQSFLDQSGTVEVAQSVDDADFVLLHGSEIWLRRDGTQVPLEYIETGCLDNYVDDLLAECLACDLPLACANPDVVVQTPTGGQAYMPGKIAERYAEMGGNCQVFGKPHVEHFEACVEALTSSSLSTDGGIIDRSRIAHVGDSLHHDVGGANAAGLASVFVASGIHRSDLGIEEFGQLPGAEALRALLEREGNNGGSATDVTPTHVVSAFRL